ncbi:unnamed protein product, partial [Effrenium voratum]
MSFLSTPGLRPDIVVVNSCISTCGRAAHWRQVLHLFNAWPLTPTVLSYNAALDACVRAAEWAQALEVLERLSGTSLPDVASYSLGAAIPGHFGDLLEKMSQQRLEANAVTYAAALEACSSVRNSEAVPMLAKELADSSQRIIRAPLVQPMLNTYQVGFSAVVAALDLLDAETLSEQLVQAFRRCLATKELQAFRGGRNSFLEMLPGFGGPLDLEVMAELGFLRLQAGWLPQARRATRAATPEGAAKPRAK